MHWTKWILAAIGVAQYAVIVATGSTDYVSLDTSYLVMFLCIIGAAFLCGSSCWGGYGGGGCNCCDDGCACGDGPCCTPDDGHEHGKGHEGHSH